VGLKYYGKGQGVVKKGRETKRREQKGKRRERNVADRFATTEQHLKAIFPKRIKSIRYRTTFPL
jgi:hypothetical protein